MPNKFACFTITIKTAFYIVITLVLYSGLDIPLLKAENLNLNKQRLTKSTGKENDLAGYYCQKAFIFTDAARYDSAIVYYKKLSIAYMQDRDWENYIDCYYQISDLFKKEKNADEAINYLEQALTVVREELGDTIPYVWHMYEKIGRVYRERGDYDQALEYYGRGLVAKHKVFDVEHQDIAKSYTSIGRLYLHKSDYDQALNYFKKALIIFREIVGEGHLNVASVYNNIGVTMYKKNAYDQALEYHRKALAIRLKIRGVDHEDIAKSYSNIGIIYDDKGDYDRALDYYKKVLHIKIKLFGKSHPRVTKSYINLGAAYHGKKDYKQALDYYKKALEMKLKVLVTSNPDVVMTYTNIGRVYEAQKNYTEALNYYQKSIVNLVSGFKDTATQYNPKLDDIINEPYYFLDVLKDKARAFDLRYTKQSQDIKDLRLSIATYQLVVQLIDKIKKSYKAEGSKLFYAGQTKAIYDSAICVALKLYHKTGEDTIRERAFYFAERNKSGILREALSESRAKQFSGIPDSLLNYEQALKAELNYYDNEVRNYRLAGKEADSLALVYQNRFFDLKRAYDVLIETFEKNYSKYHQLKYSKQAISIGEIQRKLPAGTAMIEYFFGDNLYAFYISKDSYRSFEFSTDSLKEKLGYFKELLQNPGERNYSGLYRQYNREAYVLYQQLLKPVLSGVEEKVNRLIIIPDGLLYYLPFETLLTNEPAAETANFGTLPYLIRNYAISYAYSATILFNTEKRRKAKVKKCLAFAYSDQQSATGDVGALGHLRRGKQQELPGTQQELLAISKMISGAYLYGNEASERAFKTQSQAYQLIHLALHGTADTSNALNSHIVFPAAGDSAEDGILYAYELYNTSLHADLAVLSACETAAGKLREGEGIMGLSRAFLYAGVPAIVATMWKVHDQSAAVLMNYFYEELARGQTKDKALQQAKLRYLEKAGKTMNLPAYWSAAICIGDTASIDIKKPFSLYWLLLMGLLLSGFLGLFYKRRRKAITVR